jgi:hypothetical protein
VTVETVARDAVDYEADKLAVIVEFDPCKLILVNLHGGRETA